MAGRNMAPDLSGMFGAINQAIADDKTGSTYIDTFRRSMAPKADMDDSASLLRYAEWARRNGYEEEARQYLALGYKQKDKEAQEAKDKRLGNAMVDAEKIRSSADDLGNQGFFDASQSRLNELRGLLDQNSDNPVAVERISKSIREIEGRRSEYETARDKENARRASQLDRTIKRLDRSDPNYEKTKAELESVKNSILAKGNAELTYNAERISIIEQENTLREQKWLQVKDVIVGEMMKAGSDPAAWEALSKKYGEFAANIAAMQGPMMERAELLSEVTADNYSFSDLPNRIARDRKEINESTVLTDEAKERANSMLDKVDLKAGEISPQAALTQYQGVMTQIDRMYADGLAIESSVDRQRQERAEVALEKAELAYAAGPSDLDVQRRVEQKYGPIEKLDEAEREEAVIEVRKELQEALANYLTRMEIRAGYAEPEPFDDQDKKAASALLKSGASIDEVVFKLASEGYDRKSVIQWIKEGSSNQVTLKQAEDIYEVVLAEVETNDERVSQMVDDYLGIKTAPAAPSIPAPSSASSRNIGRNAGITSNPGAVSNDHATRTREALRDPANLWQGITLTPFENKLSAARDRQNAGQGFEYPDLTINSSTRRSRR